jgi:CHASE2 domain-containing sensor protein
MRANESDFYGSAAILIEFMSASPRWGYTGLVLGVAAALATWILHQARWLEAWDGVFYDPILSWTARWRDTNSNVLLLRLAREDVWPDTDAINTLSVLENLGAKAIVLNFLPSGNSREFFQQAADRRNVVFGRELRPDPDNPDILSPVAWPAAARDLDLPWGVVFLPPSLKGVYRWQHATVTSGTDSFPTLEHCAATLCNPTSTRARPTGPFLINFMGGPGSIPNVPLAQALAGELIPEMVKGKVVLVGTAGELSGLETPVCDGAERMSFLEFQGNALQTLLDGTPIRPLPWIWTLSLLTGLGLVSSLLYQRVNSAAGARLVLGLLLVSAVATAAGMWFFRLWIPLGLIVVAQAGQFALTLVFKTRMTNRSLNEMRLYALNQIKERNYPEDALLSPAFWDYVVSMISQTLEVQRMLFFERIPQTQQLLQVKCVNCRVEDLQTKERTLDTAVFSQALAKGSPVQVSGIFGGGPPEVEYLCPLVVSGEVLGMWAVGIDAAKAAAIPQMEMVLGKFSHQLANLVHQRKRATPKRSPLARLRFWLSKEREDQAYRELRRTVEMLEQYYDTLEAVLNQIGAAMIVYDPWGRVLRVNEPAQALLRAENFVPARATALDFLRVVTGRDEPQVRNLLRNVLLEGSPASMSVKLTSQGDRQFLLRVYPLSEQTPGRSRQELFNTRGIVCELVETTSLSTLASLKGVVADRLGVELRDHLAAIEMSAALLEMDSFSMAERRSVLDAIHDKTKTCVQVISECQKYLGRSVDAYAVNCYPLDSLEVLNRVCSGFAPKAAERRVTLQIEQPRLMDQVLASTADLERLFSASLELLQKDAAENTVLTIEVEDASEKSSFRFSNCGFGIPNERLQQILTSPEIPASEEFRVLREALVWVGNWAGNLEITSDVGRGYSIALHLRQFKLNAFLPRQSA